ncbi:MAG: ABC transporter substrate-binding protein [Bosea sp. (in: a-proteobacteria)]
MSISRRTTLGILASAPFAANHALAQAAPEKAKVTLGVGGKALLYYLPLTIAERRGLFKEQGLEVEINDFGGGAKSLQALIGGSVDVVTGAFEHIIRMQAKAQDVRGVVELGRFPGIVIGVRKAIADKVKTAADFKGLKIGVTAPGSSTALTAQYAMVKAGLKVSDAPIIGVGGGASAVAAMKQGQIDIISHLDPVISKLEADGDIVTLIDTRTEAGTRSVFGGANPAGTLYLKGDFAEKNPVTTQRLANAFMKALKWIDTATPEQIADVVPTEYHLGDKPLYLRAVAASKESYSRTGIPTADGIKSMFDSLKLLDAELANATVDMNKLFMDRFVRQASV